MTDPMFMLLLIQQLGPEYAVWDTAAEIEFVKPGKTTLTARMEVPLAAVEAIRAETADGAKSLTWFETSITDRDNAVVARVRRQVYARKHRNSTEVAGDLSTQTA